MRNFLWLITFMCCMYSMHAQNISVKGKVASEEDGLPLPGVNIIVKNENKATVTDFDGNFIIDTPVGSNLEFSYLGFKTKEITIINSSPLNIPLEVDAQSLNEVVVIGYGTQQKKDVTGAVAVVGKKTIEKLNPTEVAQALQGSVSGVSINSSSGSPGSEIDISIRGVGSNTDNGPLVIIDGYRGSLDSVNPQDVESITVLKDGQAAIYGIDGANGVILLTTKRGKKNTKTKFSYNSYAGFQETTRELPLLNAVEYATIINEGHTANGEELPFTDISSLENNTDWQDLVFDRSFIQNHSFSFSGGGEKTSYYVGASRLDQEGIVTKENSNYIRNNVKIALDVDLRDNLKFSSTVNYINSSRKTITNLVNIDTGEIEEFGQGGILFNAINFAPTFAEDEDDTLNFLGNEVFNPISQANNTFNDLDSNGLEGSFSLNYEPIQGLKLTSRIGFKTFNNEYTRFFPIVDLGNGKVINQTRSRVLEGRNTQNDYTFENFITYTKTFGEYHNFSAVLGMSAQQEVFDQLEGTGFDVPNNDFEFADIDLALGASEIRESDSKRTDVRRSSLFGRIQYDFDKRYLISGIIRRDVSSAFSPENRVAYFPSVTVGWNLSEEAFWNEDGLINLFKLRASYGELGSEVGNGLFRTVLDGEATAVFDGSLVNGRAAGQIPNLLAQWEVAKKIDLGLDLSLFDRSLEIVIDYFRDDRENLLIDSFPVSGISGSQAPGSLLPTVNAGTSRNEGLEFLISYKHNFSDDFSAGISYNMTYLKNEVIAIDGEVDFVEGGDFGVGQDLSPSRMEEGFPIGYFYGFQTDGIFQNQAEVNAHPSQNGLGADETSPGDIRYVDVNGDGVINLDDRTNLGDPIPDFLMGLNLNFQYKQVDFSLFANAQLGKETVRNYERDQPNVNRLDLYLDRFTGEGTSNLVPRTTTAATNNRLFSDFFVEDSSFLRIQNIQVGFSFPQEILDEFKLTKFRVYASINNLYTFTNYIGFDPAASDGIIGAGIDSGFYPVPRQYLLGVNLNF